MYYRTQKTMITPCLLLLLSFVNRQAETNAGYTPKACEIVKLRKLIQITIFWLCVQCTLYMVFTTSRKKRKVSYCHHFSSLSGSCFMNEKMTKSYSTKQPNGVWPQSKIRFCPTLMNEWKFTPMFVINIEKNLLSNPKTEVPSQQTGKVNNS